MKKHHFSVLFSLAFLALFGTQSSAQRNQFDHRGIALNTAAPLAKGSLNYYNYYLFFNELEFAPTKRFSVALGNIVLPELWEYNEWFLSLRLRYAIEINERLHGAFNFQSVGYYYFDSDIEKDVIHLYLSSLTYTSPRFTGTLFGGLTRYTYDRENSPTVGGQVRFTPRTNGVLSFLAEGGWGSAQSNAFLNTSPIYPFLVTAGVQFAFKRTALQVFLAGTRDDYDDTYVIPGISFRALLRKPRVTPAK